MMKHYPFDIQGGLHLSEIFQLDVGFHVLSQAEKTITVVTS